VEAVSFEAVDPSGPDAQRALHRYLSEVSALRELEAAARDLGYRLIRLDTNEVLVEAVRLYERHGYRRIDRYHDHPDPTHFYEKSLSSVRRLNKL
jgi:hypothetical protein